MEQLMLAAMSHLVRQKVQEKEKTGWEKDRDRAYIQYTQAQDQWGCQK